jgi:malonate-semialdehyde dehydrogenase (acetylating)/methylmalonate-semialdehyde dehydrogenase
MWMFPISIACGNSFILKPSEQTPLAAKKMAEIFNEVGLPEGVFNVVNGDRETARLLIEHETVKAIGFVGSTPAARSIYALAGEHGKRALALGGAKNHITLMPDADPDIAAANIVASAMDCAGQRCMAASVLITVGNCDEIMKRIIQIAQDMVPGKDLGAVISQTAKERIIGYIDGAETEGAKILVDGRTSPSSQLANGSFVGPTIIDGVSAHSACVNEEIFGPVLSVLHTNTLDEALTIENASSFGNAAAIYTSSGAAAEYYSARANAGMVGVNIGVPVPRDPFPFGGWNTSRFGAGDITGEDGIRFWSQSKKITSKWTSRAARNWMS